MCVCVCITYCVTFFEPEHYNRAFSTACLFRTNNLTVLDALISTFVSQISNKVQYGHSVRFKIIPMCKNGLTELFRPEKIDKTGRPVIEYTIYI